MPDGGIDLGARMRLEALLGSGTLSSAAEAAAHELLRRLDMPARVTLFGLPGAGRARVLNLLAEEDLLPVPSTTPTLLLRHGDTAQTIVTMADASRQVHAGKSLEAAMHPDAAFVEMRLPAARLRSLSMMIVVADDDPADQAAALTWARSRTDIAIWCSRAFDPVEAAIWSCAPETLRDNSYLVMTEARQPMARGDFLKVFTVDMNTAPGEALPEGAARMIEEVRRFAERGRQAVQDQALLFLSRYTRKSTSRIRRSEEAAAMAEVAEQALAAQAEAVVPEAPTAAPTPKADPLAMLKSAMAGAPSPAPKADAVVVAMPQRAARPAIDPGLRDVPRMAADFLRRRAQDLARELPAPGTDRAPQVLSFCQETMDELVERVTSGDLHDTAGHEVEDLLLDAADVILLLQSEEGEGPAADAVALLLQLRRDLETRIAA